jgi:hypothetical protein
MLSKGMKGFGKGMSEELLMRCLEIVGGFRRDVGKYHHSTTIELI